MKINKQILENRLRSKFNNLALYAIVNETYLGALVYGRDDLTKDQSNKLSIFSYKVLESLGGFSLLEKAIESETDINKVKLLGNIYQTCVDFATEATNTNLKEIKIDDQGIDEVVDSAAFTKEEYSKLINKSKDIDLKLISNLIKDKVVKVIKEEQEEYRENERIEKELSEAIQENEESEEENDEDLDNEKEETSLDSYLDLWLGKSMPRKPISLFSKIQDITLENILIRKEDQEIDLDIMLKVALENVLFNKVIAPVESSMKNIGVLCESLLTTNKDIDMTKKSATLVTNTISIYTALETLSTLNLLKMNKKDIVPILEQSVSVQDEIMESLDSLLISMESDIGFIENISRDRSTRKDKMTSVLNDIVTLEEKMTALESVSNEALVSESNKEVIGKIKERLNNSYQMVSYQLEQFTNEEVVSGNEPSYVTRDREFFIVELNKIARRVANTDYPKDVCINYNPDIKEPKHLSAEIKDNTTKLTHPTIVPIKYRPSFGSVTEYVKESINNSKLIDMNGSLSIYNVVTGQREIIK